MIKKIFTIAVAILAGISAFAQKGVGTWDIVPVYSSVSSMIETPQKVYYLSGGNLYSYDKENEETYIYNINNKLHDTNISKIKYNFDAGYLAVVYANANIDLIYDDGKVVNMSDIKEAVLTVTPVINHISFGDGELLAATNFGLVLFDDVRHQVKESGVYYRNISIAAIADNYIFAYQTQPNCQMNIIEKKKHIQNIDDVLVGYPASGTEWVALSDNTLLALEKDASMAQLVKYEFQYPDGERSFEGQLEIFGKTTSGSANIGEDSFSLVGPTEIYTYNYKDGTTSKQSLPAALKSNVIAFDKTDGKVWAANSAGIGHYDISGENLTVLSDRYKPEGTQLSLITDFKALKDGGVYVVNGVRQMPYFQAKSLDSSWITHFDRIKDGHVTPMSVKNLDINTKAILPSPNLPNTYYVLHFVGSKGLEQWVDGEYVGTLTWDSSTRGTCMDFDANGNIYMLSCVAPSSNAPYVMMLPKEKEKDFMNLNNWVSIFNNVSPKAYDPGNNTMLVCKHSNFIFLNTYFIQGINMCDTKGTASAADDEPFFARTLTDQDGKEMNWSNMAYMTYFEDHNGDVWVCSELGVVKISNLKAGMNNVKFTRLKVPRNDGTNYADYLLESEQITSGDVDASNRKWIATKNNGVYLVSADGSEILEHFTSENSSLPVNTVYAVKCDLKSNTVYFGTPAGVVTYNSTAAPAADDFSDVYAYPNPVRPEYTGWIIVKNLMDKSLIKIADAAGNVFFQGTSEGGMIAWDGCDASGNRVKTGVYYVFASNTEEGMNNAVVTKILVVN